MDAQSQEAVAQAASIGGISSLASACWLILTAEHFTWTGFVRANVLALFVAVMCFEGLKSFHMDDGLKFVVTSVGAVGADYILRATLAAVQYATSKPVDFLIRIVKG